MPDILRNRNHRGLRIPLLPPTIVFSQSFNLLSTGMAVVSMKRVSWAAAVVFILSLRYSGTIQTNFLNAHRVGLVQTREDGIPTFMFRPEYECFY